MGPMQKLTVLLTLFWLSVLTVGWTVILALPTGWARKATIFYTIDMGLYQVEVSEGTGVKIMRVLSGSAGQQAEEKLKHMKYGTFSQHDHASMWCQLHLEVIGVNTCFLISIAMYSSWAMLLLGIMGLISLVAGGLMLYTYAFMEAHKWMRNFMKGAFTLAAFLFFCASSQYAYLIEVLKELPPASEGTSANYLAFVALILTGLTLLPVAVAFFLEATEDEVRNEIEEERMHFERDQKLMGLYGSTGADKLEQGGQPQMQQAYGQPGMPGPGGSFQGPGAMQGPPAPGMAQPGPAGYPGPGMAPPGPGMGPASSNWAPAPGYGEPAYGGPPAAYGGPPAAYGGPPPAGYGGPPPEAYGGPPPAGYGGPQPEAYGGPQPEAYGGPPPAYSGPPSAAYGGPTPAYGGPPQ